MADGPADPQADAAQALRAGQQAFSLGDFGEARRIAARLRREAPDDAEIRDQIEALRARLRPDPAATVLLLSCLALLVLTMSLTLH